MTKSPVPRRKLGIAHISHYADPEKFQHLLEQFNTETPDCPWNRDAAETLAKPLERRGWQVSYVKARENWRTGND